MARVVEPHRLARDLVDKRLPYDDTAERAIRLEELWIDIREFALEPRGTRARRRAQRLPLSRRHPLGAEPAGRGIWLDVEQAQEASVRVVHVKGPHEIDHFALGEMACELVLLFVCDPPVVDVILFGVRQYSPLSLREG